MLIQVRVQLAQAQRQIAALQGQVGKFQAQTRAANAAAAGMGLGLGASLLAMRRWGSQLQWAGRQLTYNFSIPLAIAGAASTKWALDLQKAQTRVAKVYGDNSKIMNRLAKTELPALNKAFEALSNFFGVAQTDVTNIAADWAAAGASGIALAKSVKLTLETMILGEIDAATATKALIAIQAQFGLQVQNNKSGVIDLSKTIDILNMVENQTGATMADLINAMARTAGSARIAGIDVQHLSAMIAALVPAAGSASNAGNGLKTMISRLLAPTKIGADVMKLMGINVDSASWAMLNGSQRLEVMAKAFSKLSDSQKTWVTTQIAGRWQISRFAILLQDVNNKNGYYQKSLKASADEAANFRQRQKELNMVLDSNPRKLEIIKTILQNAMIRVIQPLIPTILMLANSFAQLANAFSNLSPQTQRWIAFGLLFLTLVGPIAKYIGVTVQLFALLGETLLFVTRNALFFLKPLAWIFTGLGKLLTVVRPLVGWFLALATPWKLLAGVVIGAITYMVSSIHGGLGGLATWLQRTFSGISGFFHRLSRDIINAFNALPAGIQTAFIAVMHVVETAAHGIHDLFSYLNPFAHHSPSVVESTQKGMQKVSQHYDKPLTTVQQRVQGAANDVTNFNRATASIQPAPFADARSDLSKVLPQALPQFDKLIQDYKELTALAARVNKLVDEQQKIVNVWKTKLDAANAALDKQQKKLDVLQAKLSKLQDAYQAHQDAIDAYTNMGITGMRDMDNAIFDNQMAQNKLQLQMLKWQDVNGSIEDIQSRMSSLAGDLEKLRGEATDLRLAGAGSDVLGPINAQVNAMQAAYDSLNTTGINSPLNAMQKELDSLQRQGQELDLTKSINYDPLIRQIQQLTDGYKELPFDQIVAGIKSEQAAMAKLQPQIDAANAAVEKQQAVVDKATAARDRIQARYDAEEAKLQKLQDRYALITDAIQSVTDALNNMASAASAALQKTSAAASAGGVKLPTAANWGGSDQLAKIGREGGLTDQSSLIDQFTKDMADATAKAMGSIGDLFAPLKNGWSQAWAWMKTNLGPVMSDLGQGISSGIKGIGDALGTFANSPNGRKLIALFQEIGSTVGSAIRGIGQIFKLFWPDIERLIKAIIDIGQEIWNRLEPAFIKLWKAAKPIVEIVGIALLGALKIVASILSNTLAPAMNLIIDVFSRMFNIVADVLDFITKPFQIIVDLIKGDFGKAWNDFTKMFSDAWDIIKQFFGMMGDIFKNTFGVIIGTVKGFVEGIVNFFKWLYDLLIGNSIIPDLMKGIVGWFEWLLTPIKVAMDAVWGAIKAAWDAIETVFTNVWNWLKGTWSVLWNGAKALVTAPIDGAKAVLSTTWDAIETVFSNVWTWLKGTWSVLWNGAKALVTAPIDAAKVAVGTVLDGIKTSFSNVWNWLKDTWSVLWDGLKSIITSPISAAKDVIKTLLDGLSGFFSSFVSGVKKVWDGLKQIFKEPIYFFTHTVYKEGLEAAWNTIVGAIGLSGLKLPDPPPGWSTGGVLPGYEPGRDTVLARLSKGEGILRPEVVRDLGVSTILQWNRQRGVAGFDDGGIVGGILSGLGGFVDTLAGLTDPDKAYNWVKNIFDKIVGLMDRFTGNTYGKLIAGFPKRLVSELLSRISTGFINWVATVGQGLGTVGLGGLAPIGAGGGGGTYTPPSGANDPHSVAWAQSYAQFALAAQEFGAAAAQAGKGADPTQWNALLSLWYGESGWRWNATNPHSGAYGIPQALPPEKMAAAGADWLTNAATQINWGLAYIAGRYGTPVGAYSFWLSQDPHWYEKGGIATKPTPGIFGEHGNEILAPLTPLWNRFDKLERKLDSVQQNNGGDVIIQINGNLEFPNITNSSDAEDFITSLKRASGRT